MRNPADFTHQRRRAWPLIGCAVALLFIVGAARADAEEPYSPPEVLLLARLERTDLLLRRADSVLSGLGAANAESQLRTALGAAMNNPELTGVVLSQPLEVLWLGTEGLPFSTVWKFSTSDKEALAWALFFRSGRTGIPSGELRFDGDMAAWGHDADAVAAALRIEERVVAAAEEGTVKANLRVADFLRANDEAVRRELEAMRTRMAEALEGVEGGDAALRAARTQLNRVMALLRQTERIEIALRLIDDGVKVEFGMFPVAGTPAALFVNAQRGAPLTLPALCPAETGALFAHNMFPGSAIGEMALGLFKLNGGESGAKAGPEIAMALLLSPEPGKPVEILDIREGSAAEAIRRKWESAAAELSKDQPFLLRPVPAPEGEEGVRLAQLVPNEELLSKAGMGIFRHILGDIVLAAQETRDDITTTSVGTNPVKRLREVRALAAHPDAALSGDAGFRRVVEMLPSHPGAMIYVSPEGVRRWLALGGVYAKGPRFGVGAGLAVRQGLIEGGLVFPTDMIAGPVGP
jgi:hypothetical protein